MELYLIRHGQSANNANPGGERHADPPLTELGADQAARLAEWSKALGLTRVISSPFLRAMQTAESIRKATASPAEIWTQLHEQGGCCTGPDPVADLPEERYSGCPGMTDGELADRYPHFSIPSEIGPTGWWGSRPFETMEQAQERAASLFLEIKSEFCETEERIALVFHGMLKLLLLDTILSREPQQVQPQDVPFNTSISKISITRDAVSLDYFNGVEHLPELLLTS